MPPTERQDMRKWFRDYHRREQKEYRHVSRDKFGARRYPFFGGRVEREGKEDLDFGVYLSEGGWLGRRWMTTFEIAKAVKRWVARSYQVAPSESLTEGGSYQCGGCRYFAAFDADYGLCCNPDSEQDGRVCFEHGGCIKHSNIELGIVDYPKGAKGI